MPHQREGPTTKTQSASHSKKENIKKKKKNLFLRAPSGLLQAPTALLGNHKGDCWFCFSAGVSEAAGGCCVQTLPGLISMTTSHWISTPLGHSIAQPCFSCALLSASYCASPRGSTTISEHPQWAPMPLIFTCVQTSASIGNLCRHQDKSIVLTE